MANIHVFYQHRVDGPELVNFETQIRSHRDLCDLMDRYPWTEEQRLTDETGEGGGFHFTLKGHNNQYAVYQFTPVDAQHGLLDLSIVIKPGWLGIFGRQALEQHFDVLTISAAQQQLKELFSHSPETLYRHYKNQPQQPRS